MKNFKEMKTSEMVAEYNLLTGKTIKKFSSRAAAEKQLEDARSIAAKSEIVKVVRQEDKLKRQDNTDNGAERGAKIADSWLDKKVRSARCQRDGVLVDGRLEYRSVKAAFIGLELPLGSHIKFRTLLKKQKRAEFQGHEFTLI